MLIDTLASDYYGRSYLSATDKVTNTVFLKLINNIFIVLVIVIINSLLF